MSDIFMKSNCISIAAVILFVLSLLTLLAQWRHWRGLLKGAENMSTVSHKSLKIIRSKFVQCYHMNEGMANIPAFVKNCLEKDKICGIRHRTFEKWSMQFLFLSILCIGAEVFWTLAASGDFLKALPYYGMCALELCLFFSLRNLCDVEGKQAWLELKLVEYFENHLVPRLKLNEAMSRVEDETEYKPARGKEKAKGFGKGGFSREKAEELEAMLREMMF